MSTGRKALANPCAVPRYRAECGRRPASAGVRKLPAVIVGMAVGITSFAAIAGSFTVETMPQRVAMSERTPRSVIDSRFFIVTPPAVAVASKRPPQTADACDDLAFRFLNAEKCGDGKRVVAQPRRDATMLMAHSGTPSPDLNQSRACQSGLNGSDGTCRLD